VRSPLTKILPKGRSHIRATKIPATKIPYATPQVRRGFNPRLIAKVLSRGLKSNLNKQSNICHHNKVFVAIIQSVSTDFSYETGVSTPGGLADKQTNPGDSPHPKPKKPGFLQFLGGVSIFSEKTRFLATHKYQRNRVFRNIFGCNEEFKGKTRFLATARYSRKKSGFSPHLQQSCHHPPQTDEFHR